MTDVVVVRWIAASPTTVFSVFTDVDRWTAWQGVGGELDARAGGLLRVIMPDSASASGALHRGRSGPAHRLYLGLGRRWASHSAGIDDRHCRTGAGGWWHHGSAHAHRIGAGRRPGDASQGMGALPRAS